MNNHRVRVIVEDTEAGTAKVFEPREFTLQRQDRFGNRFVGLDFDPWEPQFEWTIRSRTATIQALPCPVVDVIDFPPTGWKLKLLKWLLR